MCLFASAVANWIYLYLVRSYASQFGPEPVREVFFVLLSETLIVVSLDIAVCIG